MKNLNRILTRWLTAIVFAAALIACEQTAPSGENTHSREGEHHAQEAEEAPRGPHSGRLLTDGTFSLELAVFESGVPPEFRAWVTESGKPVDPATVSLQVQLARLGGVTETIQFAPHGDLLRGDQEVYEPHSFDVRVTASYQGKVHEWEYESYEGRTTIPADVARSAGIETAVAGPGTLTEALTLYGAIVPDASRVREVRARFPGVVQSVSKRVGEAVMAGETLVSIESNESLRTYNITAPLNGVVTERHAEPGEQTSDEPLFQIADFSRVWAELKVFPRERARLRTGQRVRVKAEGTAEGSGTISYIAPVGERNAQNVTARVVLDNLNSTWTSGQFVEGVVTVAETSVPLAVPLSSLQTFRDHDVVFAQVGDTYEVRMVELGRRDAERAEVLGGLAAGTRYVTQNSYLIKADIEKSGASHDH
jgi:cobalt-zinc-cadmium efflux system membrane fusion protein